MMYSLTPLNYEWEQLKNCFQRLEWIAESRGITVDELHPTYGNRFLQEHSNDRLDELKSISRLRSLIFRSHTS